jgi:peptidoglycan-associated lipoprotein
MHIHRTLPLGLLFAGVVLAFAVEGCGPGPYPNCDNDKDCKPKEFCVARKCQQCRQTTDCPAGTQCNAGKCGAIPGFCTDRSQCGNGQECINNTCRPCESDGECGVGLKCMQGQCKKAQCTTDNDCPQDKDCQNGMCVGKTSTAAPCNLTTIYFGFDQSTLTSEATSTLTSNGDALKKSGRNVDVVGRADPRGTTEYNMALSDRRAQAAKDYLQRLGVPDSKMSKVPRGALDATGSDESGWAKDRRVDFECR